MAIDELVINLAEEFERSDFYSTDSEKVYSSLTDKIEKSKERVIRLNLGSINMFDPGFIKNALIRLSKYVQETYKGEKTLLFTETQSKNLLYSISQLFEEEKRIFPVVNDLNISLFGYENYGHAALLNLIRVHPKTGVEEIRERIGDEEREFNKRLDDLRILGIIKQEEGIYKYIFS